MRYVYVALSLSLIWSAYVLLKRETLATDIIRIALFGYLAVTCTEVVWVSLRKLI